MRTAIIHPWYLANGGAEQTVSALADIYPKADLFTLFYRLQDLPPNLHDRRVIASSINWLPAKYAIYRYFLPAYPLLFESLDLRGYDLVITSDSSVTKGVLIDQNAIQICYCHSPMRCLWDLYREYASKMSTFTRPAFTLGTHYVRQWDFSAAQRVDAFVANSFNVAERIKKFYARDSTVIYPPVETKRGFLSGEHDDYYLSVGRLADTKRIDLLIAACNRLRRRLIVVGAGREEKRLKAMAGPTIEFPGRLSDDKLGRVYSRCRAVLFAAYEDFGIVPVEAQSYGRPVIAYGKGGSLETIVAPHNRFDLSPTGVYFASQTQTAVENAILEFEQLESNFIPKEIQSHVRQFDSEVFAQRFSDLVAETVSKISDRQPNRADRSLYANRHLMADALPVGQTNTIESLS
jgi:glycosyltransferase involved in cell wall biosynthesis